MENIQGNHSKFTFELNYINDNTIIISTGKIASTFIWNNLSHPSNRLECRYDMYTNKFIISNKNNANEFIDKIFESEKINKIIVVRNPYERLISSIQHQIAYTIDEHSGLRHCVNNLHIDVKQKDNELIDKLDNQYQNNQITDDILSIQLLEHVPYITTKIIDSLFYTNKMILDEWVSDIHFGNFYFGMNEITDKIVTTNTNLLNIKNLNSFLELHLGNLKSHVQNKSSYDKKNFSFSSLNNISQYVYYLYLQIEKIGITNLEKKYQYL